MLRFILFRGFLSRNPERRQTTVSPLSIVIDVCALLLLSLSAYWDLRYRRIPNWATLPCIILGLGMNTLLNGWGGPKASDLRWRPPQTSPSRPTRRGSRSRSSATTSCRPW